MLSRIEVAALGMDLLDLFLTRLAGMLRDDCYAARQAAAVAIPRLYSFWADPKVRCRVKRGPSGTNITTYE